MTRTHRGNSLYDKRARRGGREHIQLPALSDWFRWLQSIIALNPQLRLARSHRFSSCSNRCCHYQRPTKGRILKSKRTVTLWRGRGGDRIFCKRERLGGNRGENKVFLSLQIFLFFVSVSIYILITANVRCHMPDTKFALSTFGSEILPALVHAPINC